MRVPDLATATWRKSSRSSGGADNCVEVAAGGAWAAVRDSKDVEGPVLVVGADAFGAFVGAARAAALG